MQIVNIHEAKSNLSRLVREVEEDGAEFVLARAGHPVARLVPIEHQKGLRNPGSLAGRIHMADDFDETPADLIELFEGGDSGVPG